MNIYIISILEKRDKENYFSSYSYMNIYSISTLEKRDKKKIF